MPGAKRQLMEIESALGMGQGTLSKMALSSAELGDKMSKIRFPDTFTEEQKTMIANMAEMGEGGEYIVANTTLGAIQTISIINRGTGYTSVPTINLQSLGDGTATATIRICRFAR